MDRKTFVRTALLVPLALAGATAAAGPFSECPEGAFLAQTANARFYAVDLGSGNYRELHRTSGRGVINAIGFSVHDSYLYGWNKPTQTLLRIHEDYTIDELSLTPAVASNFYVGDVSILENAYYMYRRGRSDVHGLWRVDLDDTSPDYLSPQRITDGQNPFLNIFDFAFHPDNGLAYTVDPTGRLYSMDPATGQATEISNVGVTGTFGAVYFDIGGNFYISHNATGRIYSIDLTASSPTATYFSQGPSSSQNDGARCALASVPEVQQTLWDFGDAPNSYGTDIDGNGARHQQSTSGVFIGDGVDFETQAMNGVSQSDENVISADDFGDASIRLNGDEDGVVFSTSLSAGDQAIVSVKGGDTAGLLNAWIDFNQNGKFDDSEQVLNDYSLASNANQHITISVPSNAENGLTWARFRVASDSGIQAVGGAADGEVEDYQVSVSAAQPNETFYPSSNSTVSVAFEDLWPGQGDYDLNDFVVQLRTSQETGDGMTTAIGIEGDVTAVGASFRNGFAIQIDEISRSQVVEGTIEFEINGETVSASPLEDSQSKAVFVISENIWDFVEPEEGCSFYRTERNCGDSTIQFGFKLRAQLVGVTEGTIAQGVFNPFLFATPGFLRSTMFSSPPGRPLEIHLKNALWTDLFDTNLFGRGDDASNAAQGLTYQTATGLPWAIEIGPNWEHPTEFTDLVEAYPDFVEFVTSGGSSKINWFNNPVEDTVYRD